MKKGTKIALVIIGAVAAGCALTLAFGGIPLVKKADQEFTRYQDVEITPYPYAGRGVPDDYVTLTYNEWTLSTPVELECQYAGEDDAETKKRMFRAEYGDGKFATVFFLLPDEEGEVDLTGASEGNNPIMVRLRDFIMNGYAKQHGYEIKDMYTFSDYLYHMDREHPGISLRSGLAYYGFAECQDNAILFNKWDYHTDNADGWFDIMNKAEEEDSPASFGGSLELYPKDDRSMRYSVILKASDEEKLSHMLNSVKLDPGKAETEGDNT